MNDTLQRFLISFITVICCEIVKSIVGKISEHRHSKEHSIPSCMLRWCNDSESNSCPGAGNPAEFAENCCADCEFYKNNPDGK